MRSTLFALVVVSTVTACGEGDPDQPDMAIGFDETSATLSWPLDETATKYVIERKTLADAEFAVLVELDGDAEGFVDTGLQAGVHYFYALTVRRHDRTSARAQVEGWVAPRPPGDFWANCDQSAIHLVWSNDYSGVASFRLERAAGAEGPWETISDGITGRTFEDSSVQPLEGYVYRLLAVGHGDDVVSLEVAASAKYLFPPQDGTADYLRTGSGLIIGFAVQWRDVNVDETGFIVDVIQPYSEGVHRMGEYPQALPQGEVGTMQGPGFTCTRCSFFVAARRHGCISPSSPAGNLPL